MYQPLFSFVATFLKRVRDIAAKQAAPLIDIWQAVVNRGGMAAIGIASIIKAGIDIPGDGFDGVHLGPGGASIDGRYGVEGAKYAPVRLTLTLAPLVLFDQQPAM